MSGLRGRITARDAIDGWNRFVRRQLRIYNFRRWRGRLAFLLDYSWAAPYTALGYGLQLLNECLPDSGYDPELSQRAGAHVYRGGIGIPGFVTTLGNVTTSLGTGPGADSLMVDHESVHVWQSRIFGPLFPLSYLGWMAGGFMVGTGYWLFHRDMNWYRLIETAAYYDNPWEVWAYANHGNWPPAPAGRTLLWPHKANPSAG